MVQGNWFVQFWNVRLLYYLPNPIQGLFAVAMELTHHKSTMEKKHRKCFHAAFYVFGIFYGQHGVFSLHTEKIKVKKRNPLNI